MEKTICSEIVKTSLDARGWTQKRLADEVGVTGQSVTNWLKGVDFPRPDKLLKLATTLRLSFDELVMSSTPKPIVAFRKKAGTKSTDEHITKAMAMGAMLQPVIPYLPANPALRLQIPNPSIDYKVMQSLVANVREKHLGIGMTAELQYQHLIGEFESNGAVIIPVLWGKKDQHKNALHIHLPAENVTFIYLNLDTHIEDFKFWMAHELAHVYTPKLAGKDEGEDFADAFAGALLVPRELARAVYAEMNRKGKTAELRALQKLASAHKISLYTVFKQVSAYAKADGLPQLTVSEKDIHATRANLQGQLVSEVLFSSMPPEPKTYLAAADSIFRSAFFHALQSLMKERGTGAGYVQQLLDVSLKDAKAIHAELLR